MLGHEIAVLPKAIARSFDLNDDGVVKETVEERRGDDGIAEYRGMPQFLIGESLTSRSQTRVISCLDIGCLWCRSGRRAVPAT